MRVTFIPWIALAAVVVASGEVAVPCESVAQQEESEEVETITRDISLAEHARADSLHSLTGAILLRRNSRVSGDVETSDGELVLEPGSEVCGRLRNVSGSIRIDAKFRELVLECCLDRARVGFSVEAQQPRLVEIETLVVASAEAMDPLQRTTGEPDLERRAVGEGEQVDEPGRRVHGVRIPQSAPVLGTGTIAI